MRYIFQLVTDLEQNMFPMWIRQGIHIETLIFKTGKNKTLLFSCLVTNARSAYILDCEIMKKIFFFYTNIVYITYLLIYKYVVIFIILQYIY